MVSKRKDRWIDANEMSPSQWADKQSIFKKGVKLEGRFKVKLADGRQIYATWEGDKWSVERLKPNLKVAYWVEPVFIA
jgi:hypothetical protein